MTASPEWLHTLSARDFLRRADKTAGDDDRLFNDLLWLRMERDAPLFAGHYFPDLCYLPFNVAHRWLFRTIATVPGFEDRRVSGETETAIAAEAPRGLAKTTILKLIITHRIVYGLERYVLWGGVAYDEAVKETNHLRAIFENPTGEFEQAYGPFVVRGTSKDWSVSVAGNHTVYVSARGFPKGKVRGSNRYGQRPTMIVGDDVEHPELVRNPNNRRELATFISSDVRNAGPKEGGLLWVQIGTRLHTDSQTARNAADPAYTSKTFKAVQSWPDRQDLWDVCKAKWSDLTDADREATARAFYEANKADMDKGVEVLDPIAQPVYKLHQILWSRGAIAFSKDFQNEAIDPSLQVFQSPEHLPRCRFDGKVIHTADGRQVPLTKCRLSLWLDPRSSESMRKNDYAALPIVAQEQFSHGPGYCFVIKTLLDRVSTETQVDWLWTMFDRFGPSLNGRPILYGYEDNGFQSMMGSYLELKKKIRADEGKATRLHLKGHCSKGNKMDRIMGLAPQVALRWIQFDVSLKPLALQQLHGIPTGAHDDFPDALERAIWHLTAQQQTKIARGNPFRR